MKNRRINDPRLLLLALLFATAQAAASVTVDRDVTMTDAAGGTLVLATDGRVDIASSESLTTATFTDFSGVSGVRSVNGQVLRDRTRGNDELATRYDGALSLTGLDEAGTARSLEIAFENLVVVRNRTGPDLSGSVVINGEELDASILPSAARRLLVRTLRFFRFA
jgi:hypothetical protein